MDVINIPESFVCFSEEGDSVPCSETNAGCFETLGACYPINEIDDLHFQVLIGGLAGNDADRIIAGTVKFWISIAANCQECQANSETFMAQLHIEPWKTSGADQYEYFVGSIDTWIHPELLQEFSDGQCLVLCLWKEDPDAVALYEKMGCSNCFIKTEDTCDTSIIYYRQNETSMGFYNNSSTFYDNYFNSIRLPFKLSQPQVKTQKNVYRKSDGSYLKMGVSKAREWTGTTDYISEKWHMKLDIALDHDQLKITNENAGFSEQFFMSQEDNNYKVDWQELGPMDYPHGPATFKLMESPYNEYNSNCQLTPLNPDTDFNALLADQYNILLWD